MQNITRVVTIMGIAAGLCAASPVFAESAPVFDADAVQQQLDNNDQQIAQEFPPQPPAPAGQEFAPAPEAAQMGGPGFDPGPQAVASAPQAQATMDAPSTAGLSMSQRVRKVEQQVNSLQTNDATTRVEQLQTQIQALRGQVEELTHQLQQSQNQQKAMYEDFDKRLGQANAAKATQLADASANAQAQAAVTDSPVASLPKGKKAKLAAAKAAAQAQNAQPNLAEEQQAYQNVYNMIKAKKYTEAVNVLQTMLKKYPSGQFACNAHYWLGELYTSMGKSEQALTEFNLVVQSYPDSPRVSDAQLKVGLILASQTKWSDARVAFKNVVSHYPGTASAQVASQQLKQLKQAGH